MAEETLNNHFDSVFQSHKNRLQTEAQQQQPGSDALPQQPSSSPAVTSSPNNKTKLKETTTVKANNNPSINVNVHASPPPIPSAQFDRSSSFLQSSVTHPMHNQPPIASLHAAGNGGYNNSISPVTINHDPGVHYHIYHSKKHHSHANSSQKYKGYQKGKRIVPFHRKLLYFLLGSASAVIVGILAMRQTRVVLINRIKEWLNNNNPKSNLDPSNSHEYEKIVPTNTILESVNHDTIPVQDTTLLTPVSSPMTTPSVIMAPPTSQPIPITAGPRITHYHPVPTPSSFVVV